MIATKSDIQIERSDSFVESAFQLAANSTVFSILRNSLYSDKIGAILREYSSNMRDSHVASGQSDREVILTLPSALDSTLRFRDFGSGLTDSQVRNIFCSYGSSTKDTSNDYIGAFGIGSKSFAAYSKSCSVTSIHRGMKKTYSLYIDETEMGKVALLTSEQTDEESGIEVAIPVQTKDIPTFLERARHLFRFVDFPMKVIGNSGYHPIENEWMIRNTTWGFLKPVSDGWSAEPNHSYLVMGFVPYRIDRSSMTSSDVLYELLDKGIVIFAPIGAVEVSASRESISYIKKTEDYIRSVLKSVEGEAVASMDVAFAKATTLFDTKSLYYDYFSNAGKLGTFLSALVAGRYKVAFNGAPVVDWNMPFDARFSYTTLSLAKVYGSNGLGISIHSYSSKPLDLFAADLCFVSFDDDKIDSPGKVNRRLRYYMRNVRVTQAVHTSAVHLRFKTRADMDAWIDETGVKVTWIELSSIVIPKVVKGAVSVSAKKVNKDNARILRDNTWASEDIDTKAHGGYYVVRCGNGLFWDVQTAAKKGTYAEQIESAFDIMDYLKVPKEVYAFRPEVIEKLGSRWKPFKEYARKHLQAYYDAIPQVVSIDRVDGIYRSVVKEIVKGRHPIVDLKNPIYDYLALITLKPEAVDYTDTATALGVAMTASDLDSIRNEVIRLNQKLDKLYPMCDAHYSFDDDDRDTLVEYINAVDHWRATAHTRRADAVAAF